MGYNAVYYYDEGAGRSANEETGASEQRNQETGNNGRDETLLWADAAGYTECNGERQGNDADDYACDKVRNEPVF